MPTAPNRWPDYVDLLAISVFVFFVAVLPLLGYWFLVLDIRAYLRALRGVLVVLGTPEERLPNWLRNETPPCLRALDLEWPCSETEVKTAYRRLAQRLHPDHGGDVQRFLQLHQHFEQSLHFVRQRATRQPR